MLTKLFGYDLIQLMKKWFLAFGFIFLSAGFSNRSNVFHIESSWSNNSKNKKTIQLKVFFPKNYGLQKGSLHQIHLYSLSRKHKTVKDTKEKIDQYGKLLQTRKTLSGVTSEQNNKYFSAVDTIPFKRVGSVKLDHALRGKLFYCSFKDGFCSIYSFAVLIPGLE